MKKFIPLCVLVITVVLFSCKKNGTSSEALNEITDTSAVLLHTGVFSNGPYGTVSGEAKIFRAGNSFDLTLMNFNSGNGPDLRVYLAKQMPPVDFVDLGALKSTMGNQVYEISTTIDFTEYKYALIHCRQFNHLFGWALLQ